MFQQMVSGLFLKASLLAGVSSLLAASAVLAQDAVQDLPPAASAAGKPAPAASSPPKPKSAAGDSDLRRRVEQLEDQVVDMQAVIGTLQSLARQAPGGSGAPKPIASTADAARLSQLENQVRSLSAQIEQLSGRGAAAAPAGASAPLPPVPSAVEPGGFGSTTVNPASADPIGGLIEQQGTAPPPVQPVPGSAGSVPNTAAAPPSGTTGNAKQDYERAYGYLLQQDYGAAQAGFTDFLKAYPRDSLVLNALYWLGETHFVQRNYADAAEAFDLVMQGYSTSPKAADSLVKRGLALGALGKKSEACALLGQLPAKYPSAPPHLKSRADGERQRLACS